MHQTMSIENEEERMERLRADKRRLQEELARRTASVEALRVSMLNAS